VNQILALTLQGIQDGLERMEKVSLNLSNIQTNGYKKERLVTAAFADVYEGIAKTSTSLTDFSAAPLKQTGQKLDFGLEGSGFFEVATDKGTFYTRLGSFQVDSQGKLVTIDGSRVLGKEGDITIGGKDVSIDAQGNIFDNANADGSATQRPFAQLKVVDFEDKKNMKRLGNGMFSSSDLPKAVSDADIKIKQGYLETSNVNSMSEMLEMMQTLRQIESMQKIVQGYDEMMAGSIRKLSEF
jgi:flagellar basal-body rod protein FlgF